MRLILSVLVMLPMVAEAQFELPYQPRAKSMAEINAELNDDSALQLRRRELDLLEEQNEILKRQEQRRQYEFQVREQERLDNQESPWSNTHRSMFGED